MNSSLIPILDYALKKAKNIKNKNLENQIEYSQYFTNIDIGQYMASLASSQKIKNKNSLSIVEPGIGSGILSLSLIKYALSQNENINKIDLLSFEIDPYLADKTITLLNELQQNLLKENITFNFTLKKTNFLYYQSELNCYDFAIINPPYKKIKSNSDLAKYLKNKNISHTNLYSSFLELIITKMDYNSEIISITPRSFTNGHYFNDFRKKIFQISHLKSINVMDSRKIFDDVLQEFVICKFSTSLKSLKNEVEVNIVDEKLHALSSNFFKENDIINYHDYYKIRIPILCSTTNILETKLSDLPFTVSTGPIVDFREGKNFATNTPDLFSIPYIFPEHFNSENMTIEWPKVNIKKFNYINFDYKIKNKLRAAGNYVVVKRFSSKEEDKRIVASLIPESVSPSYIAFDNKVNYFHINKNGLDINLAKGLCVYLNTETFDNLFREYSGSTQVNVSDLKSLPYPTKDQLLKLHEIFSSVKNADKALDILLQK
ncbi:Eco57I restriction-modification methylase domain-containing protein [Staphylococcus saprophyticus]|nr:Eco57I restriction-modification methylase domain-containing protein [Staphylococcus saprophyticus]